MGANVTAYLPDPYENYTPLDIVLDESYDIRFDIAQLLIDHGADVNKTKYDGNTFLTDLVDDGNFDDKYWNDNYVNSSIQKLGFLFKNGIDVTQPNKASYTPITIARCQGKMKVAKYLGLKGAVRDIDNEWWYTIHECYYQDDIDDQLQSLIDEGVDINLKADNGTTALSIAKALHPSYARKMIESLEKAGAK